MMEIFNIFSGFKLFRLMRVGVFILCFAMCLGVVVWFVSVSLFALQFA